MQGLMMDFPLTLTTLLERAARLFPSREIASRYPAGMHRYTYYDFRHRTHRLAHALHEMGLRRGDRVATLCWNGHRHLELYFAVPCSGAVLHTLNLRLSDDQLVFIINHAADRFLFADASLLPLVARIRDRIRTVERVVVLPDIAAEEGDDYEQLLAASSGDPFLWPELPENTACATCYTSGTTGDPKAVLYSHRAIFLHSYASSLPDAFDISGSDTIYQIVPMFHANGWGFPYSAVMNGARLVFSGRQLQPEDIAGLIESERVTITAAVPTVWMQLLSYLETHPRDISSLRFAVAAGSALPRPVIEQFARRHGLHFRLGWGMTETTPIATVMSPKPHCAGLGEDEQFKMLARHGLALPGIEIRVLDENGDEVPWDGFTMGELQVRGLWVTCGYYNDPRGAEEGARQSFQDGWFRTGDVATIDAEGYIQIMDRTKDLIKSGGEWISSVDLENALMGHPKVMEAAVIAVPHEKWQERPLAVVVPLPEHAASLTREDILEFLAPKVAKWWLPDDVVFLEALPKTSVGKFNKRALRAQFSAFPRS